MIKMMMVMITMMIMMILTITMMMMIIMLVMILTITMMTMMMMMPVHIGAYLCYLYGGAMLFLKWFILIEKNHQVSNFSWDNGSHRRTCAKVGIYGFIFNFMFN